MIPKTVLMVAAENDALPNAKVGGIGDVVRDIPPALASLGCTVHVIIPSHGFLHTLPGAERKAYLPVQFAGDLVQAELYRLSTPSGGPEVGKGGVYQWVIHHADMSPGSSASVYSDDGPSRPFASDATKYAFFCMAVGQAMVQMEFGVLDVLHLHDWHAAFLAILRAFDKRCKKLQSIHTVFTIHNLALQGVRPFAGDPSSMEQWYPALKYNADVICDPWVTHCVNPMRAGIELSDKVHTVSPTYAEEIQRPTDTANSVYGGEGLERVLQAAAEQKKLVGVLNGCEYPDRALSPKLSKVKLISLIKSTLVQWAAATNLLDSAHYVASDRLSLWASKKTKGCVLTSVGRITEQKAKILRQPVNRDGLQISVLDALLQALGQDRMCILLGSGDPSLEAFILGASGRHQNLLFLKGYSDALAQALYASGDLFLMPSSFEPCGISQMLAMRAGQACVVHGVGGLKDTVHHNQTGYVFDGENGLEQGEHFIETTLKALALKSDEPKVFKDIGKNAAAVRFSWADAAQQYMDIMY